VENAFKHGILNDPAHPVTIHLQASNDRIDFTVRNKYNNSQKDKTPGIGLTNVKRRLELLYPGRHHLQITEGTDYMIHLTLQLAA
jgi:LytS/YehU family sensor histidine kinase